MRYNGIVSSCFICAHVRSRIVTIFLWTLFTVCRVLRVRYVGVYRLLYGSEGDVKNAGVTKRSMTDGLMSLYTFTVQKAAKGATVLDVTTGTIRVFAVALDQAKHTIHSRFGRCARFGGPFTPVCGCLIFYTCAWKPSGELLE